MDKQKVTFPLIYFSSGARACRKQEQSHYDGRGTHQASVAAGPVAFKLDNNQQGATMSGRTNRLVTQEVRERYGDEVAAGATAIS